MIGVETRHLSRASPMDRLKTKRSVRRAQNTKILQEARLLLTDPTVDKPKLSGIFDRLSASNNELSKLNDALEEHIADDELEAEYVTAAEYNDQAISMLAEIRCKIDALERADSTAETASQNPSPTVPYAMPRIGPRLPNLDMPTFKGEIHKWAAFWEQFEQTVHLNNAISTTTKFFYLRHYLAGEAAAAIAGLPTTEACYADAVELLKERFGDCKRIVQHHLTALRHLPHVKSGSDVRGLRQLYDAAQLNIRCLTALNVPTVSFSAMLIDILQKALPYEIVLAYTRGKRSQTLREHGSEANVSEPALAAATSEAELKELLMFTRVEVESREQCNTSSQRSVDDRAERTRGNSTASILHSASYSWSECFFCRSKKHCTRSCDANLSLVSKKEKLAKDNRCYRCTSRGHQARSCQVKLTCSACHGRHASSMCDPNYRKKDRYTELFKTHMDYIERTKILFGSDRMEMAGVKGSKTGMHFALSRSPGGPASLGLSGETTPAKTIPTSPDYPDLISPTKSNDSNASLKSEIQEVRVGTVPPAPQPPQSAAAENLPPKVGQVQKSGWVDGFSTDMSMSETTSLTPEVEDIEDITHDDEVGVDKTTVRREQRRPNTLYQELSFHDENMAEGEEGSDVTDSDAESEPDNHGGKNVTDNIFGMGKEVENIIMENIELLATKNALNIVKDDLIARVDLLTSEKEILQSEVKALEHARDSQKQKIHELEDELRKIREELEKMKAAKSDDEQEDVPMAQRKRFTRVEMARVLMERNQYKERYMELQEAIRWTGMIKASRTDPTADPKKNRSSIWKIFSNLFSATDKPQQKPVSTVNVRYSAPSTRLSPALESMRKKRLGEKHRGFDFLDSDLASERLQAQRARERREQYKQVRAHVRKEDGRVQAYGWSLPTKTTPVKLDLPQPPLSAATHRTGGAPSHVPVPVPVFCRPLQETNSPMKVWCAAGVNLTGGRTRDGGTIVGASIFYKEQKADAPSPADDIDRLELELRLQEQERREQEEMAQRLSSLVWICASTRENSEVYVVDANNPADILDTFHVCPSHLLCIASVPGAKETDYPVDEEFNKLGLDEMIDASQQESSSSSKTSEAQSGTKDQDGNPKVGKLVFVKSAPAPVSRPSSPPKEKGEGGAGEVAEAVDALEEMERAKAAGASQESAATGGNSQGGKERMGGPRRPWVLLKEGAPPDIVKDGISELPTDNHLAYDQLEKMSSVLPTMWLGSQNGIIYVHSSVAQWRVCIDSVKLADSVLSIVHVKGRVFAALADGTVAIFHRKQDGQWDLRNYHLLDLGKPHHSIRCMTVAHTKVWCGYRNRIHVVHPKTLTVEHSFDAHPRKESQIRQMAWVGDGVWVTIRLDSTLRLYNVHTYQHLQDIDIEPYVSKMLGTGKLGFSFVRITALLISCNRLWMGTGNGVIISVPLSEAGNKQTSASTTPSASGVRMPGAVVRVYSDSRENITTGSFVPYCSMAQAQLSFHGHRDSVKFFVAVPGTGGMTSSDKEGASEEKAGDIALGSEDASPKCMLVLSGGEGYIDFRVGDGEDEDSSGDRISAAIGTPVEKKLHQGISKSERSHLIVWEVALNE